MEKVLRPLSEITFEAGHCPTCGTLREAQFTHMITGEEDFLHRTLKSVGVPPLHILRAHNGLEYRFYELTGDLQEALHFRHFEKTEPEKPLKIGPRIRIKEEVHLAEAPSNTARGRVRILDEEPKKGVKVKATQANPRAMDTSKVKLGKSTRKSVRTTETTRSKRVSFDTRQKRVKMC